MHSERSSGAVIPRSELAPPSPPHWPRQLLRVLSPEGRRGRLTTLIFHRVHPEPDSLFPDEMHATAFRARLRWIGAWFNVLPLEEAVTALARGTLPERALSITFDDGYADNFDVAWPMLREHGLPATFFVSTGFLDGGRMWNDTVIEAIRLTSSPSLDLSALDLGTYALGSAESRRAVVNVLVRKLKYLAPEMQRERVDALASIAGAHLPDDLMMTSSQIRGLAAAGMGIGGHTVMHPILTRIEASSARRDIADGRDALEAIIRQPVRLFAYPNGKPLVDYAAEHVRIVQALGFSAAVSTSPGAGRMGDPVYQLPRFTPWDASPGRWALRLAGNLLTTPLRAAA